MQIENCLLDRFENQYANEKKSLMLGCVSLSLQPDHATYHLYFISKPNIKDVTCKADPQTFSHLGILLTPSRKTMVFSMLMLDDGEVIFTEWSECFKKSKFFVGKHPRVVERGLVLYFAARMPDSSLLAATLARQ